MDLKQFATNEQLENEGVWEDLDGDARVKVARLGNKRFQQKWKMIPRAIKRRIDNGTLSDKKDTELFSELIAETLLLDWENLTDEGVLLEYSKETAKKILIKYKEFRSLIWELANDIKLFSEQIVEDDAKN